MVGNDGSSYGSVHSKRKRLRTTIVIVVTLAVAVVLIGFIWYLSVLGFGPRGSQTPGILLSKTYVQGGWQFRIAGVTSFDIYWDDVRVTLDDGSSYVDWGCRTIDLDGGVNVTSHYATKFLSPLSVTLTVTDIYGNGKAGTFDYFTLTSSPFFSPETSYTVYLTYEPTAGQMGSGVIFSG